MDKVFFIAATLLLTAYGQLMIRARAVALSPPGGDRAAYLRAMMLDPWVWSGLIGAVFASICWILALQRMSVTLAYPFMALSFVLVPLGALWLLREPVSPVQWLGSGLIVAGVALSAAGMLR